MAGQPHISVLLEEVVTALAPRDGAIFVDGTFGAGGYSKALLDAANCRVFGIDRDPSAVTTGEALAKRYDGRFDILGGCFGDMEALLAEKGVASVDGITLDLGVSSMQIDQAERGFSFQKDGPLDMRMSGSGRSAADLVNYLPEGELADILWRYGEERQSRRIARAIVMDRKETPFETTRQLAELLRRIVPGSKDGIDPATRTITRAHVGGFPIGITVAGGSVWVIDNANATVIRLDPSTLRAIGQPVSLPSGSNFYLGASDGYLFIADDSDGTVTRIDTHTGETAGAPIRIAPASQIGFGSAYAIAPAGTAIWATSPSSDTISRIQTKP